MISMQRSRMSYSYLIVEFSDPNVQTGIAMLV